ncbi:MAG: deoxyribose-phosphate aldolase [Lachnospiraceae bacterium]|nr:deoxyribose-phosphate aldolase [Lachnospiraceae bacterium]MDD3616901.1 deoxyribose-phosphate aldolase [Lachnospiraceae bacterium]
MEAKELLKYVDHTQLKAYALWEDIEKLCDEAVKYHTASVCIPPCYVKRVKEQYENKVNICTVIGFPLGYSVTSAKEAEVKAAIADGAREVDVVVNISDVKNHSWSKIKDELVAMRKAAGENILKVIIETCYLTEEEKIILCEIVTEAKADFIKTSTGFGTAGATLEDIALFKEHIGKHVKIKAAGGIRTLEDMQAYIEAGCSRIGTSSAVALINDQEK